MLGQNSENSKNTNSKIEEINKMLLGMEKDLENVRFANDRINDVSKQYENVNLNFGNLHDELKEIAKNYKDLELKYENVKNAEFQLAKAEARLYTAEIKKLREMTNSMMVLWEKVLARVEYIDKKVDLIWTNSDEGRLRNMEVKLAHIEEMVTKLF